MSDEIYRQVAEERRRRQEQYQASLGPTGHPGPIGQPGNPSPTERLHQSILDHFKQEVIAISEEEAKLAAERVFNRVRGLAGQVATRVCQFVNFEPGPRETIVIRVDIPKEGL